MTATHNTACTIYLHANGGTSETIKIHADQGSAEGSIEITSDAGGIDLNAAAGKDIDLAGGQINLTGAHNTACTIYLRANAGTSETIKIHSDQGTAVTEGAASVSLLSDAGGVELRSTADLANAINITNDGGTSGTISIFNDQGTSVSEGAESISLLSDAGGVGIRSTANLANAVNVTADGGTSSTIQIYNDQGTAVNEGVASIQLLSDAGGIGIKSGLNAAGAIRLTADAGTSETIMLHADQGNGVGSICLTSDAGGITLNPATFVTVGGNATNAGEVRILEDTDHGSNYVALKAPNVSTSYTITLPTAVAASCGLFLKSTCAGVTSWAAASGGSATKEFFQAPHHAEQGFGTGNSYAYATLNASGESAFLTIHIPADYSSIDEAVIIHRPGTCSTPDYDITTHFSTNGQHYSSTHTDSINYTTVETANILREINIACALNCIAADDYVGIHIERDTAGSANIIGVRFKYC